MKKLYVYDMLPHTVAEKIIEEVVAAVKDWQSLATRLNISQREQAYFVDRFGFNEETR